MTKKILAMFLAVMMVISLLPTSALAVDPACPGKGSDHTSENCTDYQILGLVEANCIGKGGTQARCNHCGTTFMLTETETAIDPNNHDWDEEIAEVKPTCEDDGTKAYKVCKNCNKISYKDGEETKISADKATWNSAAEKWELTESQKTALKIAHDPEADHKWVNKTPEITCENHGEDAKQERECSVCHKAVSEPITQTAHTWTSEVIKDEGGKATGVRLTCSHCLVTKDVAPVDDHDHVWVNVEKHEATCTTPGTKAYKYCAECGSDVKYDEYNQVVSDEDLVIPAVEHNFNTTGWTCKTESAICTKCELKYEGKVIEDYRKAHVTNWGHALAEGAAFDCNPDQTLKCENCEQQIKPEDMGLNRDEHDTFKEFKGCLDTEKECDKCGVKVALEESDKTEHSWVKNNGEGTAVTEADPCEDENAYCSVCNTTAKSLGMGTGNHAWPAEWSESETESEKATCVEKGVGVKECEKCGKKKTEGNHFDALGHIEKTFTVPGNCNTKSYTVHYCVREGCALNALSAYGDKSWASLGLNIPGVSCVLISGNRAAYNNPDGTISWAKGKKVSEMLKWELKEVTGGYVITSSLKDEAGETITGYLKMDVNPNASYAIIVEEIEEASLITFVGKSGKTVTLFDGKAYYAGGSKPLTAVEESELSTATNLISLTIADDVNRATNALEVKIIKVVEGELDNTKHNPVKVDGESTDATCDRNSVTVNQCSWCGKKFDAIIGSDKLNHMQDGEEFWVNAEESDLPAINAKLNTEYAAVSAKPNCVQSGYRLMKCGHPGCTGHYKVVEITLAEYMKTNKNYDPHNWHGTKPTATHDDPVKTWSTYCTNENCTETQKVFTITWENYNKTYESYGKAVGDHTVKTDSNVRNEATCTEKGNGTFVCEKCNQTIKYEIAALGHELAKATEGPLNNQELTEENHHKDPTCQSAGYTYSWGCTREGCKEKHIVKNGENDVELGKCKTLETVAHKMVVVDGYIFPSLVNDCDEVNYKHMHKVCAYEDCVYTGITFEEVTEILIEIASSIDYDASLYENSVILRVKKAYKNTSVEKLDEKLMEALADEDEDTFSQYFDVIYFEYDTKLIVKKTDADLCKDYNYEVYACPCGQFHVRNLIGNFGHQWVVDEDNEANVDATCTKYGKHVEYCALCNPDAKSDEAYKDAYKIVTDAKRTYHINSDGIKFTEKCNDETAKRDCVTCEKNVGKLHTLIETKHEVCGSKLYYSYDCADCDYTDKSKEIGEVLQHEPTADSAEKPEATYEDQTWTYTCTRCEQEITEIVNLKGMHLVVDGKEFTYGSLITVTVRLDNVKADLATYCFDFKFDSANVALVGYKNLVDGFAVNIDTQTANTTGTLTLAGAYIKDTAFSVDGDVELIELTFRVKTNAAGDLVFSYAQNGTSDMFVDGEREKVEIELLEEQKVTVKRRVLGDFNNNNVMDISDVREALGMITYENSEKSYDVTMDVNFDGEFTAADVQILLELLSIENDAKRNEAINALVREAMGEEHAALCFELHECTNCDNAYYEDFKYCPNCGHETAE